MRSAQYMVFQEGHHGSLDRLGGLPTHLPPTRSSYPETGRERAFLAQFYCVPGRFELDGVLCVQFYQDPDEDEPCPAVVTVPVGSPLNDQNSGVANPRIRHFDIRWEPRKDPDEATDDDVVLTESKAGGTCYFHDTVQAGETMLLQLRQRPAGFNFGGYTVVLVRTVDGSLVTRLG